MTLSRRLAAAFVLMTGSAIAVTIGLLIAGMALEIQAQIDREQRRLSGLAAEIFRNQCASMQTHLAALAGDGALRILADYSPAQTSAWLESKKPTTHVDGLYLLRRAAAAPVVIGESIGQDFLPADLPDFWSNPPRVRPIRMASGQLAVGFAVEVLPKNPHATGEYWLLGVVELEEHMIGGIAAMLGIEARIIPAYPAAQGYRLPAELFTQASHAGWVQLRDCNGSHLAWLEYRLPLQPYRDSLARQALHSAAVGTFILLAAGLVGVSLARRIACPIEQIEAAAARMEAGDLSARATVSPGCDREMCRLSEAFNGMAETLSNGIQQRENWLIVARLQLNQNTQAIHALRRAANEH